MVTQSVRTNKTSFLLFVYSEAKRTDSLRSNICGIVTTLFSLFLEQNI